jgi:hypothetical protein
VDAQAKAKATPNTFQVPTDSEIGSLMQGDFAKVCSNNERFWVEITRIMRGDSGLRFEGTVGNMLLQEDLKFGDLIVFETRHIYNTMKA